jgi:flavin-dependent dehydrogenase
VPELHDLLAAGEPIGEPLPYRFRSSRRVHYEKIAMPVGLAVLGDAMCSFNPLFGQGMSVAIQQAEHLGFMVERGRLANIARGLAAIANNAWALAVGADLSYPQVEGTRTRFGRFMTGYMRKVFRASTVDGRVVDTLWRVTNLCAPPSHLLRPGMMFRVLRAG